MILDILITIFFSNAALRGRHNGVSAELMRLVAFALAAAGALYAAEPVAVFVGKAFSWSRPGAIGLSFLVLMELLHMVAVFVTGRAIRAMQYMERIGSFDTVGGFVVAGAKSALHIYLLICACTLLTRDLGASYAYMAADYPSSMAARHTMVRNIADKEPFPHAALLGYLVKGSSKSLTRNQRKAVGSISGLDSARFFWTSPATGNAIRAGKWREIQDNRDLLNLLCDHRFLVAARNFHLDISTADLTKPPKAQRRRNF